MSRYVKPLWAACAAGLLLVGCGNEQVLSPQSGPAPLAKLALASHAGEVEVEVTVMRDGLPAEDIEVAFSRSISGRSPEYDWEGTTDSDGTVSIEIESTSSRGTSGYYVARATDAITGDVLGRWGSIPLTGGNEVALTLAIDGAATVTSSQSITPTTLTLRFSGIQPLSNGFHFEGWAIIGGSPFTTGKFNVDDAGRLIDLSGNIIQSGRFRTGIDLSGTTAIVLTIEPDGDTDTVPADTHYLAGDVADRSSALTVGHPSALGDDFSSASGNYILATPTDDPDGNENSGLWFLDLSSGSPAQGLELPVLPAGWKYEGWAVTGGQPVTTGTFTDPAAVDDSAPFSGVNDGPPFPGEDFLNNAPSGLSFPTDLAGGAAVISIEPSPDDGTSPFTLKPLVGDIPADATDHVTYSVTNMASGFPTGSATIR